LGSSVLLTGTSGNLFSTDGAQLFSVGAPQPICFARMWHIGVSGHTTIDTFSTSGTHLVFADALGAAVCCNLLKFAAIY
jgi:hypothetical protein